MAGTETLTADPRHGVRGAVAALVAFVVPVAVVSNVAAVAVHEILGHGLAAYALGGRLRGFALHLNGSGLSWTLDRAHPLVMLAAGPVVPILAGFALLLAAPHLRHRALLSLALVVYAAYLIGVNAPYALWGCVYPRGRADFGRIVANLESPPARYALAAAFAVVWAAGMFAWVRLLFRWVEDHLGPVSRRGALVFVAVIAASETLQSLLAEQNQALYPGSGPVPGAVGVALSALVALPTLAARRSAVERREIPRAAWVRGLAAAWTGWALVVAAVLLWFNYGVFW